MENGEFTSAQRRTIIEAGGQPNDPDFLGMVIRELKEDWGMHRPLGEVPDQGIALAVRNVLALQHAQASTPRSIRDATHTSTRSNRSPGQVAKFKKSDD
jgi:hypothetical protein